ncbi:hypothetical protein DL764_001028 [Monosporascus ibericus]|uniref:DOMON domain-containing protein n=1 Tax=Monosporascus ibericus TaxID=155417 RepID=A0A4Q4TTR4_9PEZI|nr:hypothetical protein DL764_001028 [Monosporascus ibericus]
MVNFNRVRLALVAAVTSLCINPLRAQSTDTTSNNTAAAVFFSPARDLAFALNVPSNSSQDLYFSIQMPVSISWGAIGLGSDTMAGSLMLMIYSSSTGENVTLSPRISDGHSEPAYSPDIEVETLPGTGLVNGSTLVYNGRCSNCRSWSNGKVDIKSKAQQMLYATGEVGEIDTDDVEYSLRIHYNYGSFTMDMVNATGPGGIPTIEASLESESIGTVLETSVFQYKHKWAMLHAMVMVFCFAGIYPFGILILRLGNWVRWHAINQGIALFLVFIGFGLGIRISWVYNRVIGILVLVFVVVQFALGFMHHRVYKKTQQTTKMAPIHVWLGRLAIILGVANGFTGFTLAGSPKNNYVLMGIVLFVFPVIVLVLVTKRLLKKKYGKNKEGSSEGGGYDLEPWRRPGATEAYTVTATTVEYNGPSGGMPANSSYPPKSDMGPQQNAREIV